MSTPAPMPFKVFNSYGEPALQRDLRPLPVTALNGAGEAEIIKWPPGRLRARCGGVFLLKGSGELDYSVVYGLQVKTALSRPAAAKEFGECCLHQADCHGTDFYC